jgi:predicted MPP superfamily phosphohydrolase
MVSILPKAWALLGAVLFLMLLYGNVWGRFSFRTNYETLEYENLPAEFDNYKVLQFSDIHIGSLYHHPKQVQRIVNLINSHEVDLILFTGDWVNNFTEETERFVDYFKSLQAKDGVYAVLGNHDYGDYSEWQTKEEYIRNTQYLKDLMKEMGFTLLNNEAVTINKENDSILLAGVENWGLPPFPQYGNLDSTLQSTNPHQFSILLSHDPSHWDAEVVPKTNIDLTLAGHTHGMQFGIKTKRFQWSPVALKYPKWGGVYEDGRQKLHVSIGIGNIGYLGRFGMWPEIDLLTLKKK